MKRDLMIGNAMAIAYVLSKENECKHVHFTCANTYCEISLFFNLHDEKVEEISERIRKSTNYTPEYENPKFYEEGFEVLRATWNF